MTLRKAKSRPLDGRPLDDSARGALEGLVRLELRSGFAAAEILLAVEKAVRNIPRPHASVSAGTQRELRAAYHVMTVWYDDPRYLGADGRPKPLTRVKFQELVSDTAPDSEARELLSYLVRTGNVRRAGTKYAAVRSEVIVRGMPGVWDARMVRTIDSMLRTANHNSVAEAPPWIERTAENENFPVSRTDEMADFLERETSTYLRRVDTFLRSKEIERRPGEATVAVTVGVYRSQQEPSPVLAKARRARSTRKRKRI